MTDPAPTGHRGRARPVPPLAGGGPGRGRGPRGRRRRPAYRDGESGPEFGLVNLVEEFTALRHELKLQTKSGRGLIDQAESTVAALRQAIEHFRSVEPRESQAAWSAGKAIAEALGDLDEALARGRREIERINRRLGEDSTSPSPTPSTSGSAASRGSGAC